MQAVGRHKTTKNTQTKKESKSLNKNHLRRIDKFNVYASSSIVCDICYISILRWS